MPIALITRSDEQQLLYDFMHAMPLHLIALSHQMVHRVSTNYPKFSMLTHQPKVLNFLTIHSQVLCEPSQDIQVELTADDRLVII